MTVLTYSESILIDRPPAVVYDLVSDVTQMGRWSPICAACWWDEGAGPRAGDWFTGRNQTPDRTWETRSQVVAAEPGREFAWAVNGTFARWGFTLEAAGAGTRLTESWAFQPDGIAFFRSQYGAEADARIERRSQEALAGIPATLAAIRKTAEAG